MALSFIYLFYFLNENFLGYIFEISTPGRVYHLCANSSDSRQKWIDAISPIIEKGLLGSLMKNRNKKVSIFGKKNFWILIFEIIYNF